MRKIIEVENRNLTTPAAEWDTKDWIDYQEAVVARQNLLVELGVLSLVNKIVIDFDSHAILAEAFLLLIAVLLGGNLKA